MGKLLFASTLGILLITNLLAQERRTKRTVHECQIIKQWTDAIYYKKIRYMTSFSITPKEGFRWLEDCENLILVVIKDGQQDNRIIQIVIIASSTTGYCDKLRYFDSGTPFSSSFSIKRNGDYIDTHSGNKGIRIKEVDGKFILKQMIVFKRLDDHLHIFKYK